MFTNLFSRESGVHVRFGGRSFDIKFSTINVDSTSSDRDINKVPLRQRVLSASADAIHRTAAVRGRAYTADPRGRYRACDRPRAQHDPCPCDAARRILDILAVNDGACWFRRCGHEASNQQR